MPTIPGQKPTGARTTFSVDPFDDANITVLADVEQLEQLIAKVKQPAAAMRLIGAAMLELVDESFDTTTGPEGRKWLPIKDESNKAREHPSASAERAVPLQDTGVLKNSFNAQVVDGGNAVSIGTGFGFYVYHQHDPDYPIDKHIMPIRNVLPIKHQPLPESWRGEIIGTLEDFLGLGAAGGAA